MILTTDTVVPAIAALTGSHTDTTIAQMDTTQMLNQVRVITTGTTVNRITPKTTTMTSPPPTTLAVMNMAMTTIVLKVLTEDSGTDEATVRREITIRVLNMLIRQRHIWPRLRFVEEHLTRIPLLHI